MENPKNLQEIARLFEEKFPDIQFGANHKEIKQFWLEHIKTLLESVRMEKDKMGCGDCDNWNEAVEEVNNQIQFLLSEGKGGEV